MPKFIPYGKKTTKNPRKEYRILGLKGKFLDPFPLGFGTVPEKIVYKALSARGIQFQYLNDITFSDPEIEFLKKYQADFILPELKIIIEVQGYKWHSSASAIVSDSLKFATYEQFGWKALAWWDYEIEDDVNKLFAREPLLVAYNVLSSYPSSEVVVSRNKTDTSKGIRTMNRNKKARYVYRKKTVKLKVRKDKGIRKTTVYGK